MFLTSTDLIVAQLVGTELTDSYRASCGSYPAVIPMLGIARAPVSGRFFPNRHRRNSKIEFSLAARDAQNTGQITRVNQFAG
jgi:hypothetical protein